ncbi:MAG: hypothetical protein VB102_00170 [Paludibacter sp.]|nr:hypothetical protein [Paludibacter sp.]
MNNKALISFLFLAVITAVYLTISIFYDRSEVNRNYGTTVISPSVSFNHLKAFQPKAREVNSDYSQKNLNMQPFLPSGNFNMQSSKIAINAGNVETNNNAQLYGQTFDSQNPRSSSQPGGNATGIAFLGTSGRRTNGNGASSNTAGALAYQDRKSSLSPSYEPFSGGGTVGLPDPGGNADGSCDEDLVFLPVPDGLHFMIFLTLVYALLKFFNGIKKKHLSII